MANMLQDLEQSLVADSTSPFKNAEAVRQSHNTALSRVQNADGLLTSAISELDQIQNERVQAAQQLVETKKLVSAEVATRTAKLAQTLGPMLNQRQAIADRMVELDQMNPIVRGFKSLFDASYDREHLTELDRSIQNQIATRAESYDTINKLQDAMIGLVSAGYQGDETLRNLAVENINQDLTLANQSFAMANTIFNETLNGIQANSNIIQAQETARMDAMTTLNLSQAMAALSKASANGGVVVVNGAPLRESELQDYVRSWQQKDLAFESAKLAIAGQREDIAEIQQRRLIDHMTMPELQAVIQTGGVYHGMQLSQSDLTRALQDRTNQETLRVSQVGQDASTGYVINGINFLNRKNQLSFARALELFGEVPQALKEQNSQYASIFPTMTQSIREGTKQGIGTAVVASQAETVQSLIQNHDKVIGQMAKDWAGGNKALEPLARAYLTGERLSGPASVDGLIALARNGLPAGTNLSGSALAAFNATKRIVASFDSPTSGEPNAALLLSADKETVKEKERRLHQMVTLTVAQVYNSQIYDTAVATAPKIARQIDIGGGKPHPAAAIPSEVITAASDNASAASYERIAPTLGLTPQQTELLFTREGTGGPIWAGLVESGKVDKNSFGTLKAQVQGLQDQEFLRNLDMYAGDGSSDKFIDLLNDEQFLSRVQRAASGQGQAGFMDYVISQSAPNAIGQQMYDYGRGLTAAQNARRRQEALEISEKAAQFRGRPVKRASVILSGIPGINSTQQKALLTAVTQGIPADDKNPSVTALQGFESLVGGEFSDGRSNTGTRNQNRQIENAIKSMRFQDPELERVRQVAAKHWDEYSVLTDNIIDRFLNRVEDFAAGE